MSESVVHLHVHSEYSLLDGANKIKAMATRAAELGMPALGLTDHGVMNGAVEHYKACNEAGIKPILGLEAYLVDDRRAAQAPGQRVERNHLTLLAASDEGFKNLVKLTSAGYLEGFARGKANVDMELLDRHSKGVIALTGCLQSRFCQRLIEGRPADARAHIDDLAGVFGADNLYFEIQVNGIAEQDRANEGIVRTARELGRPLVATGDVHYLGREDYDNHAALLCVQTKSTLEQPKLSFDTNEFFLKSADEMREAFSPWPESLPTTLEVAERCEVEIELGKLLLPRFPAPEGEEPGEMLLRLANEGLRRRYGDPPPADAVERLSFELEVIREMGFESYFLIVWDFVRYAKENGIAVGPGRGSAAGSIVAYSLNITDLDPLANDLLFERFLNPARKSMPDIDIDFSVRGRERVIRYVQEKYGRESVAQIITFGKMAPRAATRDAARVLGFDYATGDRVAKQIPEPIMGRSPSFDECLKDGQELRRTYDTDADARRIVDVARGLEGIVRNNSIHAAAVVIADRPLDEIVPLQLAEDRGAGAANGNGNGGPRERSYKVVTQYSMGPIEEIGLLKMDFLGLRNLDVIEDAVEIIERSREVEIDIERIPLDDAKTYEMLAGGDSVGVFQLESDGMRDALRKVRPTVFDDIVALVSLYRPGAMRYIDDYASGKRDPRSVAFADERLRSITEATYGCCIYQEQLMEIAKQIAGFSGAEADDLRKAVGKKKRDLMATMEDKFLDGLAGVGHRSTRRQGPVVADDRRGRLLVQQEPRRLLRADRVPHRLSQGQLHRRVHGRADLIGDVDQGQGPVLRQPLRRDGARGPAAGRQLLRPRVRRLGQVHPLRPRRRQERRPPGGRGDHPLARGRRPVRIDLGLLRAGRLAGGEQARDRVPGEMRRPRLHRRQPPRDAARCWRRRRPPGRRPRRTRAAGRARSSTSAATADAAPSPAHPGPARSACPSPARSSTSASCCGSRRRRSAPSSRHTPSPTCATRSASGSTVSFRDVADKADGTWVTVGGIVGEAKKVRTRNGGYVMFATLDDLEGQVELFVRDAAGEAAEAIEPDRVVVIRGRVDHKGRGETSLVVRRPRSFEPDAAELAGGRAKAAAKRDPKQFTLSIDAAEFGPGLDRRAQVPVRGLPRARARCSW